jgi:cyclase
MITRIIPVLLLKNAGLVKTVKFKDPRYVGDPINAVKIFNDKEVDELVFLDITATAENRQPPLEFLEKIAGECFMPLCYGGGIRSLETIKDILKVGVEKVAVNSIAAEDPSFIRKAADRFGSSTIAVSMDVKKNLWGKYEVHTRGKKNNTSSDPLKFAAEMDKMGAGELLLNVVDRDGMMQGYDTDLLKKITSEVSMPVIACGGAGNLQHMRQAVEAGASAVAAGSMFVFTGPHRAVLINYPSQADIKKHVLLR